jgi:hypothetical protein
LDETGIRKDGEVIIYINTYIPIYRYRYNRRENNKTGGREEYDYTLMWKKG